MGLDMDMDMGQGQGLGQGAARKVSSLSNHPRLLVLAYQH